MTEAEHCARLRAWAEERGFAVYPEVAGWDLVLTAPAPAVLCSLRRAYEGERLGPQVVLPGHQVGIHAKLRPSCDVLVQAMPPLAGDTLTPYPSHPFVAVPRPGEAFMTLARRLGIGVIEPEGRRRIYRRGAPVWDETTPSGTPNVIVWPRSPGGRAPLPLPSVASRAIVAGAPSPRSLSPWREKALRFLIFARANDGNIRIADLVRHGLGRSYAQRWLSPTGQPAQLVIPGTARAVRVMTYRLTTDAAALPDHGYEDVLAELVAALT